MYVPIPITFSIETFKTAEICQDQNKPLLTSKFESSYQNL